MKYTANASRYDKMIYNRIPRSGLKLPALSLGLWHNFGTVGTDIQVCADILTTAYDNGITHFDLANNYGPPPGSPSLRTMPHTRSGRSSARRSSSIPGSDLDCGKR